MGRAMHRWWNRAFKRMAVRKLFISHSNRQRCRSNRSSYLFRKINIRSNRSSYPFKKISIRLNGWSYLFKKISIRLNGSSYPLKKKLVSHSNSSSYPFKKSWQPLERFELSCSKKFVNHSNYLLEKNKTVTSSLHWKVKCCEWSLCGYVFMSFRKYCRGMSQLGRHNCSLVRKPFIMLSIHGCWLRPHHITINIWRQDNLYHAVCTAPLNWQNCSSSDLHLWHPESSCAVTLLLHGDWMMLKNACNQGGANSVTVLSTWKLVASKAEFLENYLEVSTWIFNGSLIEYHEKKH